MPCEVGSNVKQLSSAGSSRVDFCGFGLNPINQGAFSVFPPHLVYERSREVIVIRYLLISNSVERYWDNKCTVPGVPPYFLGLEPFLEVL